MIKKKELSIFEENLAIIRHMVSKSIQEVYKTITESVNQGILNIEIYNRYGIYTHDITGGDFIYVYQLDGKEVLFTSFSDTHLIFTIFDKDTKTMYEYDYCYDGYPNPVLAVPTEILITLLDAIYSNKELRKILKINK